MAFALCHEGPPFRRTLVIHRATYDGINRGGGGTGLRTTVLVPPVIVLSSSSERVERGTSRSFTPSPGDPAALARSSGLALLSAVDSDTVSSLLNQPECPASPSDGGRGTLSMTRPHHTAERRPGQRSRALTARRRRDHDCGACRPVPAGVDRLRYLRPSVRVDRRPSGRTGSAPRQRYDSWLPRAPHRRVP
jgi:hypothetical protein